MQVFEIQKADVENLNQFELTSIMNKLLLAEFSKYNLKQTGLVLSLDVLDADDGLDAYIKTKVPEGHPWLPEGISGWQFKAVRDFGPQDAVNEVLNEEKNNLQPLIREVLEKKGTYVLVVGKKDYNEKLVKRRVDAIKKVFSDYGFEDSKVEVFSSGTIVNLINQNPSVIAAIKKGRLSYKSIDEWYERYPTLRYPDYVPDEARIKIIEEIQEKILTSHQDTKTSIIRIVGLSGIGKTRLVFEALLDHRLKELVIFFESPEKMASDVLSEISMNSDISTILVIDECPPEKFNNLAKEAEGIGGRLTLIALDFDIDSPRAPGDLHFTLEKLEPEAMKEIVLSQAPGLPDRIVDRIVEYSEGFPRIAVLLAETYSEEPDFFSPENLAKIGAETIYNKIIQGRKKDIDPTKNLLMGISLFKRLGWDNEISEQGRLLCEWIGIPWQTARLLVRAEIERGIIVQRGDYIYVTPLPLANHLASVWWDSMDINTVIEFYETLEAERMSDAFTERLPYLQYSKNVVEFQKRFFLSFNYTALDSKTGSSIFLELTKIGPQYSIATLERIINPLTKEELLQFKTGRSNILWSIQKILWWSEYHERAMKILLQLALAENQTYSNNAINIFKESFKPFLSGTSKPLWERVPLLENMIHSEDIDSTLLAIHSIDYAISSLISSSRDTVGEDQGIRKLPEEWRPKNYEEFSKSIKLMLELIVSIRDSENEKIKSEVVQFYRNTARILLNNGFKDELKDGLSFIKKETRYYKQLVSTIESILEYEKDIDDDLMIFLSEMKKEWDRDDYKSRLYRYVKIKITFDHLSENREKNESILKELAEMTIHNPKLIEPELSWLVTPESENSWELGFHLGNKDKEYKLYNTILSHTIKSEDIAVNFLGGYLRKIKQENTELWDSCIKIFIEEEILNRHIIDLVWYSGTLESDVDILLSLLKENKITNNEIPKLLYGGWFVDISQPKFSSFLVEYYNLFEATVPASMIEIIHQYIRKNNIQNELLDITMNYLNNPNILASNNISIQYSWKDICIRIMDKYESKYTQILNLTLKNLDTPLLRYMGDYSIEIINKCIEINSQQSWITITEYLENKEYSSYLISNILKGNKFGHTTDKDSLIDSIPKKSVIEWVNANQGKAPIILARIIPLKSHLPKMHPLTVFLLENYGNKKGIQDELSANWYTEGFMGSASKHYQNKASILENWKKDSSGLVKEWISRELDEIYERIKREVKKEEEFDLFN